MEKRSLSENLEQHSYNLRCPITQQIMADPVDTINCHTYEKEAIEKWFESNSTEPLTREFLLDKTLRPNKSLKKIIDYFLIKNSDLIAQNEVYFIRKLHDKIQNLILDKNLNAIKAQVSSLNDYRYFTENFGEKPHYSAFYLSAECGSVEILKLIFDFIFEKKLSSELRSPPPTWKPLYLKDLINIYHKNNSEKKENFLLKNFNSYLINTDPLHLTNHILSIDEKQSLHAYLVQNNFLLEQKNLLIVKAARYKNENLFDVLVAFNADVNSIDSSGLNCFYYAIKNQNLRIFNLILQKLGNQSKSISPLQIAIDLYPNNFHLFDKIIDLEPSYLNMPCTRSRTVLFYACKSANLNLVIYLLNKSGLNINHLDLKHQNCLHSAVRVGNREIIGHLVKKGADINQKNVASKSPFDLADKRIKQFILDELQSVIWSNIDKINSLEKKNSILNKEKKLSRTWAQLKDVCPVGVGNAAGKIDLVDLLTGKVCMSLEAHKAEVFGLEFSSDANLFSCSADGTIKQWDLETGSCIKILNDTNNSPHMIKLFTDTILVSVGRDNVVKKWDLVSSVCVAYLHGHEGRINCFKVIKPWLVTASADKTIRFWDLSRECCHKILHAHETSVNFVHPVDDMSFISASSHRTFKIWDLNSYQVKASFGFNFEYLDYDILLKNAVMVDQNRIFYFCDLNIYGLSLDDKQIFATLNGHSSEITQIKCFYDEKLVSVSSSGEVKVWNLKTLQCIYSIQQDACRILSLELMPNLN